MDKRKELVIECLLGVARKHGKRYCFPSQRRILDLVGSHGRVVFSRRTLNRDLRWLEDNGYLIRVRRHYRGPGGCVVFRSTLYKFCGKLFNYLNSLRNRVNGIFSFFRVPKWAQYRSSRKPASGVGAGFSRNFIVFVARDGSKMRYDRLSGEVSRC